MTTNKPHKMSPQSKRHLPVDKSPRFGDTCQLPTPLLSFWLTVNVQTFRKLIIFFYYNDRNNSNLNYFEEFRNIQQRWYFDLNKPVQRKYVISTELLELFTSEVFQIQHLTFSLYSLATNSALFIFL